VTPRPDPPIPSALFNVLIVDLVRWDVDVLLPHANPESNASVESKRVDWLRAALATAAYRQRRRRVRVTDLDLVTYRYGGDPDRWPAGASRKVRALLDRLVPDYQTRRCRGQLCPWSGRKHRHFVMVLPESLCGVVTALGDGPGPAGSSPLDFGRKLPRKRDRERLESRLDLVRHQAETTFGDEAGRQALEAEGDRLLTRIRQAEQGYGGRLARLYLPALLLGAAAGLSQGQVYVLTSLAREVTRVRGRSKRPDRAVVFTPGGGKTPCPFLPPGQQYVAFDGQNNFEKRYRGAGYQLAVRAQRAGYAANKDQADQASRSAVRSYLGDLAALRQEFGLVVGLRCKDGSWRSLDEARQIYHVKGGYRRLVGSLVHVYAPADYLERWGRILTGRARVERRDGEHPHNRVERVERVYGDGDWLRAWLGRLGLSHRQAARELGVSAGLLGGICTGRRGLSPELRARAESYLAARADATEGRAERCSGEAQGRQAAPDTTSTDGPDAVPGCQRR
jgi:hypothetical protein